MRRTKKLMLSLIAVTLPLLLSGEAYAQTPQTPTAPVTPPAPPPPCTAAENRQFDFWIGDWDVTTADGKPAGTNLIKPILGSCVLHESWKGRGGFVGESFNVYDAHRKVWHQTWVDGAGGLLLLEGKFEHGSMTLSDRATHQSTPGKADTNAINEITWTPNADGSVRQHWRTSADGGRNWATSFDGKYVKAGRPQPSR